MKSRIVVCLPTYNERQNIEAIITEIFTVLPESHILVIDDNSPDGTGRLAEMVAQKNKQVHVLHRKKKEGLGRAYSEGFFYALEKMCAEKIIQMDADFSHPVSVLSLLVEKSENYELVIGSRYIHGGGTQNWNVYRRVISRFGTIYARLWLGLPFNDLTGGLKIWHAELLKRVMAYPISAGGYVFQVETTYLAWRMKATIAEVPFVFTDRYVGQSKMSTSIALEAFWRIPVMRIVKSITCNKALKK